MIRKFFSAVLAALSLCAVAVEPAAAAATPGVSIDVTAKAIGNYFGAAGLGTQPNYPVNVSALLQLTAGTGTGKADKLYAAQRTLSASATADIDLAGVLTDPLGATITCAKVKAIFVKAAAGNTNNVLLGGASSYAFTGPFADATDILSIPPGGTLLLAHPGAGWTVTAGTGDILKSANSSSGTSVTFDILVACATA